MGTEIEINGIMEEESVLVTDGTVEADLLCKSGCPPRALSFLYTNR